MGPQNFRHLHHYCQGLGLAARARYFESKQTQREFLFVHSVTEFDYVLERVDRTFALLPEILTKKAESLSALRREDAIDAAKRAIELKPDYWPAYAALSDYFQMKGDPERARQWLKKGLDVAPNAKALHRRLAELDNGSRKAASR